MRQDDGIDIFRRNGARIPIAQSQLFVALKQTAIDQQLATAMLHAVLSTGDGVGTA